MTQPVLVATAMAITQQAMPIAANSGRLGSFMVPPCLLGALDSQLASRWTTGARRCHARSNPRAARDTRGAPSTAGRKSAEGLSVESCTRIDEIGRAHV